MGPEVVEITAATPAFAMGGQEDFFLEEVRMLFPIAAPNAEDFAALSAQKPAPWARLPWVKFADIDAEIDWTLTNNSEEEVDVQVVVNGINEFFEYVPGVTVIDEEAVLNFSQWEKRYRLQPTETRKVTVRREELDEIAIDLASIINGSTNSDFAGDMGFNPNQIVYFENQSGVDAQSQRYIPNVVPGLVGLRVGLISNAAVAVLMRFTIRLMDRENRVEARGTRPWDIPEPAVFTPMVEP